MSSGGGSTRVIAAAVVWLVLIGAAALAYKYFVAPRLQHQAQTAENQKKQQTIDQTSSGARNLRRVRLSLDAFSGYAIFRDSAFRKSLEAKGINLEPVDDQANYTARLEELQSGRAPLAVFTIDALLKTSAAAGDLPGTIVLVLDETTGADAVVAYEQAVPNLDALNRPEARFVATPDSPSDTLARVVTARFSLPNLPANPFVAANGAEDVLKQFQAASPADPRAFVLWEPFVSKALENPQAHVLIDSSKVRGYIVDVLVAQREFLVNNTRDVQAIMEAYLRAAHERRMKSTGLVDLVLADAQATGQPVTKVQAERLVQGIWWKNTKENYAHFGILPESTAGGLQHLDEMIRNLNDVLIKTGAMQADPTDGAPNKLYYDKILRTLEASKWHPGVAGQGDEKIRDSAALKKLSDEEWAKLSSVGSVAAESLVFRPGTSTLLDRSQRKLTDLAETLQTFPQYYLLVQGNARSDGDDPQANRQLAADRARAAADYLVAEGVPEARIKAVGLPPSSAGGESQSVTFVLGELPY